MNCSTGLPTSRWSKLADGTYAVPTNAFKVTMDLDDWIPFPVSGIAAAYIETKDANGNENGFYNFADDGRLDTADGLLFLGREHLGLSGDLVVYYNDGSKQIFDLETGNAQTATVQSGGPDSSSMKNVRSLPDDTKSVTFQNGDLIVRVHCLTAGTMQVAFPSGLGTYPDGACHRFGVSRTGIRSMTA